MGRHPANAFKLHDMHGNVWEPVQDCWHGTYGRAPKDGSAWTEEADGDRTKAVPRDGTRLNNRGGVRSVNRHGLLCEFRYNLHAAAK